jgi:hypothetical protein
VPGGFDGDGLAQGGRLALVCAELRVEAVFASELGQRGPRQADRHDVERLAGRVSLMGSLMRPAFALSVAVPFRTDAVGLVKRNAGFPSLSGTIAVWSGWTLTDAGPGCPPVGPACDPIWLSSHAPWATPCSRDQNPYSSLAMSGHNIAAPA